MKYKRRLMTGMFAIALMAGTSQVVSAEDSAFNLKQDQYQGQVQMKSYSKNSENDAQRLIVKRNKKGQKIHRQNV